MRPTIGHAVKVLLSLGLAIGCQIQARPREVLERIPFPAEEYEALTSTGTGAVSGQAFLRTRGGEVKTAAGSEVILNPVTTYSEQWWDEAFIGGSDLTAPDPRYGEYWRAKTVDAQGSFRFDRVPAGEYFITTVVFWEAPTAYGLQPQGGRVAERISVTNDAVTEVMLTEKSLTPASGRR